MHICLKISIRHKVIPSKPWRWRYRGRWRGISVCIYRGVAAADTLGVRIKLNNWKNVDFHLGLSVLKKVDSVMVFPEDAEEEAEEDIYICVSSMAARDQLAVLRGLVSVCVACPLQQHSNTENTTQSHRHLPC